MLTATEVSNRLERANNLDISEIVRILDAQLSKCSDIPFIISSSCRPLIDRLTTSGREALDATLGNAGWKIETRWSSGDPDRGENIFYLNYK